MSEESSQAWESASLAQLLDAVAAKAPTPGGGAVTAAVAALAGALGQMTLNYSTGRKNLAEHAGAIEAGLVYLARARAVALELAVEDMGAYALVNETMKLPKDDPTRERRMAAAALVATRIPQALIATCCDLLRLFEEMAGKSNRNLRSDLAIAAVLAEAAARASRWNVVINLSMLPGEEGARLLAESDAMLASARGRLEAIERACL